MFNMTYNLQPTTYKQKEFAQRLIHRNKLSAGFTLVEALVAISILLIAVVEPLSLTANSVSNANFAKDQITAFYLAQEGIEFIRNKRDSNYLNDANGNWLSGLDTCKHDPGPNGLIELTGGSDDIYHICTFDVTNSHADPTTFIECFDDPLDADFIISEDCRPFQLIENGNLKRYGFDATSPLITSFVRAVTIYEIIPNREAVIFLTVFWKTGTSVRSFQIRERIFNWVGFQG